ncbi:MAG TPA: glycoside hydrolase family 2 TIM barrel-domain containing protein [Solirubrobacteraceae bacterium]|nr:glycoside hydrolase family 2 TIM barrel-domain containing protein [Solirubrobacteraceae bacterium]
MTTWPRRCALAALLALAAVAPPGSASAAPAPRAAAPPPAPAPPAAPAPAPPAAPSAPGGETPVEGALYHNGPTGRYLLGGQWLFRLDDGVGLSQGFERQVSTAGWQPVAVPNAWNATDQSRASFDGTVAWYRKDFRLPAAAAGAAWLVRFESVNYRAAIWLNGQPIGGHAGAFLPFELALPARLLRAGAVNQLTVRVDDRRLPTDFPPAGLAGDAAATGGWWNYGGLLREVYLERVDRIGFDAVQVLPRLACPQCPATIDYLVTVHNRATTAQRVTLSARYGPAAGPLGGARTLAPGASATLTGSLRLAHPVLWAPDHPYLYDATLDVSAAPAAGGRSTRAAHYDLRSGVRQVSVSPDGHLMLNGRPLFFRGVGLLDDSPEAGSAIGNDVRDRYMAEVKDLGATVIRSHYPPDPYLEELADRMGVMLWSEIPVYGVKTAYLRTIHDPALAMLRANIVANSNHPSVIVWSIANELSVSPGPAQADYIRDAVHVAHALDPTRPVGLAVSGYPSVDCQAAYAPLDVIGLNDYFGWYPGPDGQIADESLLGGFLDAARACYPHKALVVTEFGAEADRHGPVEERGTYEFQQAFVDYHLGVFATKPYLSGAIYWALEEFRVRPDWSGGNPHPNPPLHEKGLISFTGTRKPAYADVRASYHATRQIG